MKFDKQRAIELLRLGTHLPNATFHDGQEEAIRHVVEGNGRLLVVQKTGWGKSFVYFIATKLLREAEQGPTLLVSPLIALMRNQMLAAQRMGVAAETINSDNREEWADIVMAIRHDQVDILLISPERFANEEFRDNVLARIANRIALLVVDEAHCISDWGHDFRPHYRLLERIIRSLPPNLRILATTATANNRVIADLKTVLGANLAISRGSLHRPSLVLQTIRLPGQEQRLAWLAENVPKLSGHGIIYTLTVRDAEQVAAWLRAYGMNVAAYSSETGKERVELENALLENRIKALVATTALGMGFDKPDLAFVIHYQTPGSVVAYYQQVGRAGRALDAAYGILLSGAEETEITDYFIKTAFPTPEEVQMILEALEAEPDGLSVPQLAARINLSQNRIEKTLSLLSLESSAPLVKEGTKWQLTAAPLSQTFWERAERLTALRRVEQQQMQAYVQLTSGHMDFLIRALDGEPAAMPPSKLPLLPTEAPSSLVTEAIKFLRRTNFPIEPRLQWPLGGLPKYNLKGRIPLESQAEEGRALCVWGDAGWGDLVRRGKYNDQWFSDELVKACVALVNEWKPQATWVTCIPSLRHPQLVPDFAKRLADALRLPFVPTLACINNRPEQKTMSNSIFQARNVDGSLVIRPNTVISKPVLLIDDMVDSRWTFTIAAWLLRKHGSGAVFPLALALTGQS
jgi:ATP-dependent DNA helicase RecQ